MNTANIRLAIVGGATLKGRELADLLSERHFPARDVRLLDDEESLGQMEAVGDEVTFVQSVTREQFEHVDIAFFASDESYTRRSWQLARDSGCAIVDMSYGLETEAGAVVRSPWVEREIGQPPAPELQPAPVVVAHPAAIVLALLLLRAQKAGELQTAAATVIEPASEHGRRGMDELHEQTVSLLSFKDLPKKVFGQQIAFNLVARFGETSEPTIEAIEKRVSKHFQQITSGLIPAPAVMVLHGPSFHGHVFTIYVELAGRVDVSGFTDALAGEHVEIPAAAEDNPNNVNAAGQNEILVTVRQDSQRPNGFWIWAAVDNLRLLALNGIECAETIAAARPKGKVQ